MGSAHAERLETLLRNGVNSSDPEIKLILGKLGVELKHRLTTSSEDSFDVFSSAHEAISKLRGTGHLQLRFDCAYDCAQYFYVSGRVEPALEVAMHLRALADQSGNSQLRRKALGFSGIALSDVGDVGQALGDLASALAIAHEMQDSHAEYITIVNLGVTLLDAGFYNDALQISSKAVSRWGGNPDYKILIGTPKANCALARLHLGQYGEGLVDIRDAIESTPEPTDAVSALKRTIREFVYVSLALELGKIHLARQRSRECSRVSSFGGLRRGRLLAFTAEGLCEVYGGDVERGLSLLENAVAAAWREGWTWARAESLSALIKAYDAVGRPEKALEQMHTLISSLKESRTKSVQSLLALSRTVDNGPGFDIERDLAALEVREANLRTKIAVRESISTRLEMFERLASAADLKEEESGEHGYRVGRLAALLAEAAGRPHEASLVDMAARTHDIGKIAIPERILLSSKQLQEAERHFMSTHTTIGAELLGKSNIPQLRMAEEIARHHHEWWNGEGYPSKLKGKRIPIHARIVALADVFDALTHGRPFSPPWPIDKALEEIRARKGTQFDPELTDLFLDLVDRLRKEHQDLDEYLGRAGKSSPFLQARNRIRQMLADEREHEKTATVAGNETRH